MLKSFGLVARGRMSPVSRSIAITRSSKRKLSSRQRMKRNFLEIDWRSGMVLKADVAGIRPWSPIRIDGTSMLRRDWLSFGKIRDFHTVQMYDDVRTIHRYLHRVPFAERSDWTRQGFCECVEHAGAGVIVGPVADLDFITAVNWHPWFGGFLRNPDKDPRI